MSGQFVIQVVGTASAGNGNPGNPNDIESIAKNLVATLQSSGGVTLSEAKLCQQVCTDLLTGQAPVPVQPTNGQPST